jgi:hypothetical protein
VDLSWVDIHSLHSSTVTAAFSILANEDLVAIDTPSLRFSTVTAAANLGLSSLNATSNSLNKARPHPFEVPYTILPVVTIGNTSTLKMNYTLLLNITVLHAFLNATMPAAFVVPLVDLSGVDIHSLCSSTVTAAFSILANEDLVAIDTPSLRFSTVTAAANLGLSSLNATSNSLNKARPHPFEVPYTILPVVTIGNTSTLNMNYTLLLNITVLHAFSNATMPAAFVSFRYGGIDLFNQHSYLKGLEWVNLNFIPTLLLPTLILFAFFLQKSIGISLQDNCDGSTCTNVFIHPTVLDSYQTYDNYSFLYGIDDNEDCD